MSTYAEKRAAMLARNKAALLSIDKEFGGRPFAPPPPPAAATPKAASKPKEKKEKVARRVSEPGPGSRSSTRVRKQVQRFQDEKYSDDEEGYFSVEEDRSEGECSDAGGGEGKKTRRMSEGAIAKRLKGHRPNPKIFGHQKGTHVGQWWTGRMGCSQDGVHAPPVSGISGNEHVGAWSIALSGGYEDDIDVGYAFTFTGSGGRDLKGTKAAPKNLRTAPQSSDQTFTAFNAALKRSVETKKPVRVIRGFKGHSCFAPKEGYRYDGLYIITNTWQDVGEAGFKVCKFSFIRMAGQPDIPVQEGREAESEAIIAEYGKGGDGAAGAPRSPIKKPLNAITPAKSPAKKKEAVVEDIEAVQESPAKPSPAKKSPALKNTPASTKRKASGAVALVREKVARVGSRSSPRASTQKQ